MLAERERNTRELEDLVVADLPLLPVHGDFHRFNLLWEGSRISGIVDWDACRRDALVADIAPLLMPFMPLEAELARALLEGYQSVRRLSEQERRLLLPMVRTSLLWWVGVLLGRWDGQGEPPAGIERTLGERWTALEAAEPGLRAILSVQNGT